MLTISVKNFGPIAEGSVDLKPLTIFVGPSNTGKSYMATAVYAVMKGFDEIDHVSYLYDAQSQAQEKQLYWRADSGRTVAARNGGADAADAVIRWASELPEQALHGREISVSDMSDDLRAEMEDSVRILLGSVTNNAFEQIELNCGDPSDFVRKKRKANDFRITLYRDEPVLKIVVQLTDGRNSASEFDLSSAPLRQPFLRTSLDYKNADSSERNYPRAALPFLMMVDSVSEQYFAGLPSQSYYLPASRSGMAQTYKILSGSLVRRSSLSGISRRLPRMGRAALPGIVTEFLSYLISLDKRLAGPDRNPALNDAISFIETEVLRGRIDLDESVGLPYPEIVYEPVGIQPPPGKFTLEHSSSMVSELAPLVLFLKYLVRPGDLLILEEPESHLHPEAQLQMARGIARLVNAGVQVLITTHSNDFTGQIDNLIRMSNVSEETWASLGLEPEECLQPEQVSAYSFRIDSDKGGAVTYPLPVGSDVGIEDEEFLQVIELLYEQAITLQRNRLS